MDTGTGPRNAAFLSTHWSMVLAAGGAPGEAARAAMERLCRTYWYPLYAHIRRRGWHAGEAEDLTQEFIAQLLRRGSIGTVHPDKGRFRTFLLSSLQYFLADETARRTAQKRGGGIAPLELDGLSPEERYALEPACEETPDRAFDRRWAASLLERAFAALRAECAASGKQATLDILMPFLSREVAPGEYENAALHLGISRNAVAAAVMRLRHRLRDLLTAEAGHTVANPAEIREELRALFSA